ncbi:hypothetical protein ECANGB1_1258 [Enterospora canceri]|uniref:Uncharacterized protein n=1 Tax=Enterospora canceri TaxID=1081671 RepID=A0A1Y1S6H6_9MICR|nr:hypothetical protein ECANGB1_1258 [Enterospora canceri]
MDRNRKLAKENAELKRALEAAEREEHRLVKRALMVEYYTSIEYDRMVGAIDAAILSISEISKKLSNLRIELTEEQTKIAQRVSNGTALVNISFISVQNSNQINIKKQP